MTGAMDENLRLLLEIQDLKAKMRELQADAGLGELEREHFRIDPGEAALTLAAKVAELEGRLEVPVRRRYDRMADHADRVVVPVLAGTCYGCYMAVPTATVGEPDHNATLLTCEHCGRFLYFPL